MAQILIRDLDEEGVERLRRRTQRNGRSLQSEVRTIPEDAAKMDMESGRELAEAIRSGFSVRTFAVSLISFTK